MTLLLAFLVAVIFASGVYWLLSERTFEVVVGLSLLSYGGNLLALVASGPASQESVVSQALILTAIVISLATTSFFLVLALFASHTLESDHVDGKKISEETDQ